MQHVAELAEELNVVGKNSAHAMDDEPHTEDDTIIDVIESLLF